MFILQHPSQHAMIPINEQMDLANTLNAASGQPVSQQYAPPGGGGQPGLQQSNSGGAGEHCPKHGKNEHEAEHVGGQSTKASPSNATPEIGGTIPSSLGGGVAPNMTPLTAVPSGGVGGAPTSSGATGNSSGNSKKQDPKEIMKKRRERAICIDRVSRVIFPSTFILLNIIYWLIFSEILNAIKYSVGGDEDKGHK